MAAAKGLRAKSIGHYILGKTIGEGTFGKVKVGTHILSSEKVAVKILEKERIVDVADVERVAREIHILKLMQHPHVIQLYEIIETPRQLYLIMEYCSGGELFDHIVAAGRVREAQACVFFHQILAGVERIHQMHVVHRDLKPENLLLDDRNNIRIVDFGLSNTFQEGQLLKTACGSPCYAAPEMIAGQRYVPARCDLWSTGVILFALVCGYLPFEDQNTSALYRKILNAEYSTPGFLSDAVKDLIAGLLTTDPEKRFTVQHVRMHPWYRQLPEASLRNTPGRGEHLEEDVIAQLENFGFSREYAVKCLQMNKHNHVTSTYYLLIAKKLRMAEQLGSADVVMGIESATDTSAQIPSQHQCVEDMMDDLISPPGPALDGFSFPMAAFDYACPGEVGPLGIDQSIPAADADRAGGTLLMMHPSPRGASQATGGSVGNVAPGPGGVNGGSCPQGGGVTAFNGAGCSLQQGGSSSSSTRQQQQQQQQQQHNWAHESPRGVRAMVAAAAAAAGTGGVSTAPGIACAESWRAARASTVSPRADTPPLAMPPTSARGPASGVPRPATTNSKMGALWSQRGAQETAPGAARPSQGSVSSTVKPTPRRSTDGGSLVGSSVLSGASSSRPSVGSARPDAGGVGTAIGTTGSIGGTSSYRPGTPVIRPLPFNEAQRLRSAGPEGHEARRRPYGASSDGMPASARAAVRGPGAGDVGASSWTMRAPAGPHSARAPHTGSVSPRVALSEPRGSSLTAPAAPAGVQVGTISSARAPREEAVSSSRGAHTSSCTTTKSPKHIQQEIQRTLTAQRITFKQASPSLVKCQKLNVRFELEISKLEHLESIHVVRCRRLAGDVAVFRELSAKILAEMKI